MSSNVFEDDLELGYYYQRQLCKTDNAPKDKGSKPLFCVIKPISRVIIISDVFKEDKTLQIF